MAPLIACAAKLIPDLVTQDAKISLDQFFWCTYGEEFHSQKRKSCNVIAGATFWLIERFAWWRLSWNRAKQREMHFCSLKVRLPRLCWATNSPLGYCPQRYKLLYGFSIYTWGRLLQHTERSTLAAARDIQKCRGRIKGNYNRRQFYS